MDKLTYAIIGTGAVGGLYGSWLQQSGLDVHFLARSDFSWIAEKGLKVESHRGDVFLPSVNVYNRTMDMPKCDVVCVCLKTTQNHLLGELLAPLLKKDSIILLLQNGLGAEAEVAEKFPDAFVAGGLCFVCSNKIGPGHVHHLDYGQILLAAHSENMNSLIKKIHADFTDAGIPSEVDSSLHVARWRKLAWNIPYNGLSVLFDAQTNRIMSDPSSRKRARKLMQETVAGARACGVGLNEGYVDELMEFTDRMKPYTPSMKLDYDAGRPMEIEYIYRRPLKAAHDAGISMPATESLTAELEHAEKSHKVMRK